jgi:CheY-like chemotaxis protein
MAERIAVLDNDAPFSAVMHELLTDDGYDQLMVDELAPAHAALRSFVPQVIVLDLHFGAAPGLAVLSAIKADPLLAAIPMIICSADKIMLAREQALLGEYGCHVLVKPFELEALEELLSHVLAGVVETESAREHLLDSSCF